MTEEALQEFVKREFPAEMPVTEVADKLDTMHIQTLNKFESGLIMFYWLLLH